MEDPVRLYSGSVPELYDRHRVPVFFEPFARDLAGRLTGLTQGAVLEIAAGTGAVTCALADLLPRAVSIIASDVSQAMIDLAAAKPGLDRVVWKHADALALPFDAAAFDAVVCQFGVMFFGNKMAGYREVCRVLRPGGRFVFNVWDRIENNEFCCIVSEAVASLFPDNPPDLMTRIPYGYFNLDLIRGELMRTGFGNVLIDTVDRPSVARSAHDLAIGFCQGSPLRREIEERDPARLSEVTEAASEALLARFGAGPISGKMRAHVVTALR
jgi:SAM-dependent methyltransferase